MRTYIGQLAVAMLVFTLLNVGCVRSAGNTTKVTFRLPPKSAFKVKDRVSAQAVSQVSDFNCLAVMVSGDPVKSVNTCETSDLATFKIEKPFGPYTFLHTNSQELSVVVPRSKPVEIRVIGFTSPSGTCTSLDDVDDPHVLAASPSITYSSVDAVLELTMAFDANKKINDCKGPDFQGGDSGPYLRVEGLHNYESDENPAAKPLTRGACYGVSFVTYKPCNGGVCETYTPTSNVVINFANNDVKFYASKLACESQGGLLSFRTMTGGLDPGTPAAPAYTAFMRIPLDKVSLTGTTLANEITLDSGAEVRFTQPNHSNFTVGKPIIKFSGLAPAPGVPLSVSQLGPGACALTTTTVTSYHAVKTGSDPLIELDSHENFGFTMAGLKLLSACNGPAMLWPTSSASVTGYLSQSALADLGVGAGSGVVNAAVKLNATPHTGKYLLGGSFAALSLVPSYSIARVFASGQYDPAFRAPAMDGSIATIVELPGGSILLGGDFTVVGGQPHRGLVRLFADGSLDNTFHVDVGLSGERVNSIALYNDIVVVGGSFAKLGIENRNNLASFQMSTQTVEGWTPNPDGVVSAVLVNLGMGALFVGGEFTNISAQPRGYLASYVLTSPLALSGWSPNADTVVTSLNNGVGPEILVGGNFTNIAGDGRLKAAVFNGTNSSPTLGVNLSGVAINGNVYAMKHIPPKFYVGGDIELGPPTNGLVQFDELTGNLDSSFQPGVAGGDVKAILEDGAGVMIFGDFAQIGSYSANGFGAVAYGGTREPNRMNPNKSSLFLDPKMFDVSNPPSTTGH